VFERTNPNTERLFDDFIAAARRESRAGR